MAGEIPEQELKSAVEKRNQKINEYIRRQAVIRSIYGENVISNSVMPESIREEYTVLFSLINSLKSSRRDIWGQTIASDGCAVDGFLKAKYEAALAEWKPLRETNKDYLSENLDKYFEFPKIDFDGLRAEIQEVKTTEEFNELSKKLQSLSLQPLPEDVQSQIHELRGEFAKINYDDLAKTDTPIKRSKQNENKALVNKDKFAQIYGKAKTRIGKVFAKLKEMLTQKGKDREEQDNDLDK